MKHVGINLTKKVKELNTENYKETKIQTNQWKDISCW